MSGRLIKAIRSVVAVFDGVVAALVFFLAVPVTALSLRSNRKISASGPSGLLVLDTSYTLDQIRDRDLEHAVKSNDCGGLFERVWTLHPLVGADEGNDIAQRIRVTTMDARHSFVEVSITGGRDVTFFPRFSFAVSQARMLKYLRHLIRSGAVAMIRSADPYYLGVVGCLLARCARLPLVTRVRGNDDFIYEMTGRIAYPRLIRYRWLETRVLRFVLSRADLVFAPSLDNLDYAVSRGASRQRISVVPYSNLLNPVHFGDPKQRSGVRKELGISGRPLVATVSRLEPAKLISDVVDVLANIRACFPDAVCVIAGDGSLREELLESAAHRDLPDALILAGNRPQRWVAELLADADVVLATLIGRALVESALSGTVVVAYDCEWHGEFVTDGATGLLVPLGDTVAMAEAAVAMLGDPERATKIGSQARSHVLEVMSPAAVTHLERDLLTSRFPEILDTGYR